ncbi:DUF4145 domain-containing protein [Hoeflea sp. TYP-13]|uniref:DUF4145 domain-containing protein n=1 Tax=Hoeflea sp. TYP-13 TaxID=3230023 RepID=UPI0034C5E11B
MPLAITAPKNFSDYPDFEYPCPECNIGFLVPDRSTFKKIEPPYSESAHGHEAWDPGWITFRFTVTCVCNKKDCGEVAFVSGKGGVDQRYGYDRHPEYYEHFTIQSFFPSPRLCYIPPETPSEVENLLERSFALYWVEASAAANSLRASLEALLDELNVPTHERNKRGETVRMSLHRRLDVWADTNKDHADLCYALKEVGNLGSHGDVVKPKHYFGSLEIYSYVLKELFENNAQKMKELAKNIQDDIKTKKP